MATISAFMERHFRHFNARETLAAAQGYRDFLDNGGHMLVSLAGAMSTAELGISLAQMIREDKIHAISCTAANLEEDIFNLISHREYLSIPNYGDLTPADETNLRDRGFNRVTDTGIPESVFRHVEGHLIERWVDATRQGERFFPYEYLQQVLENDRLVEHYQIPADQSWVLAALEKRIPIYSPGFEDSTMGNIFAARVMEGTIPHHGCVRSGTEQMEHLVNWYCETDVHHPIGFFQIGGGIAGDFAICAVPLIIQDLQRDVRYWQYFTQISDSTASYGSYSGAVPNEKITWHKLDENAPSYVINSDASIVAPLIFAYVLGE
ncbi:MAG TPA: deoxyhypusine synthase [Planctomycetes bacterium]|jgi:deoxyhypusine synthase|nr:deoxyhypusine synthase [Planctomycetaceae bacterium]HIM28797.1 deoxyhypusine synthase [Planctomycetota bacterium]